jgi:hypothetical protein
MFNVESVERVELCESLLTWVRGGRLVSGKAPSQVAFLGHPPPSSWSELPGRRCRHIRGLAWAADAEVAGMGRAGPRVREELAWLEAWAVRVVRVEPCPVEANDGVQASL